MSNAAATLSLGIQTSTALAELNQLREGLRAFKTELATFSNGGSTASLTSEIERLKKELDQARKTASDTTQSWVNGNKEQEQAARTLTRTFEEEDRKRVKSAEDAAKKIKASMSQSGKIGGISYSVRENIDPQAALSKIKAAQLEAQRVASASRIDPRTLLGLPSRDYMKSVGAEIAAQFREGARTEAQRAASASRIDPRTLLGLPSRDQMKSIGAEIAAQFREGVRVERLKEKSASNVGVRALLGLPEVKSAKSSASVFMESFSQQHGPSRQELVALKANYEAQKKVQAASAAAAVEKKRLAQATREAASHTHGFNNAQQMLHSSLRGVSGALGYLWLTYGRYIPQMIAGFAAVSAAQRSFQQGIEYDYQTKFVAALSDKYTPEGYKGIQKGLEGIKDVPVDLNELARGLRVMQQTGIDAAQGLGLLETAISASILGEVDMKTATEDLVGVLEVFGMHSKDPETLANNFTKAGDVMAYVAQETKANLHDVATSMQNITGVAQQYGVSIEEATGALILLNKQGIVGPKSGTYVRSMVESLYVPNSKKAEKVLQELDFSPIDKATGKYREMSDMVDELVRKIKQYDPQSQARMIDSMFETWGAKAFRGIFNNLDEFNKQVEQAKTNVGGLLKTQTERLAESTKIQLDKLKAEFSNLFTTSFESNTDVQAAIKALRDTIANPEVRSALAALISGVANLFRIIAENLPTITAFGQGLATFFVARTALTAVASLSGGVMGLVRSLMSASGAMGPTMTGVTGLTALLRMVPGPIGLIATTLAIGVTAWNTWGKSAEDASLKAIKSVQEAARASATALANFKADMANASATAVRATADTSKKELDAAWEAANTRRKSVAKQYGLDEKDLRGDFDVMSVQKKATSFFKPNIIPTLDALKKENQEVARLRGTTLELYKLSNDRAAVEEQRAAAARAEADAVNKQTLKTFNPGTGDKTGTREANQMLKEQKNAAVEAFEHAAKLAQQTYDLEASLIDRKFEKGLLSSEEYVASRKSIEELYLFDMANAEMQAVTELNKIKESADKEHQKKMLDNAIKAKQNELAEKSRLHELEREKQLRQTAIDVQAEARVLEMKTLPKLASKARFGTDQTWESRNNNLMSSGDRAAMEANLRIEQAFRSEIDQTEARLEAVRLQLGENHDATLALEEAKTKLIARMGEEQAHAIATARALDEYTKSFEYGAVAAMRSYSEEAFNSSKNAEKVFSSAVGNMTDQLVNFAKTGKFSIRDFVSTIVAEMLKIQSAKIASNIMGFGSEGESKPGWLMQGFKFLVGHSPRNQAPAASILGGATQQAAAGALGSGLSGVGKGVFSGAADTASQALSNLTSTVTTMVPTMAGATSAMTGLSATTTVAQTGMTGVGTSSMLANTGMTGVGASAVTAQVGLSATSTAATAAAGGLSTVAATSTAATATSGGGGFLSGIMKLFFSAKGNAFTSTNPVRAFAKGSAFTNSIVSSPTLFQFAQGGAFSLGVMGEAGDEAVMPLARDNQGRLGVRAQMGNAPQQQQAPAQPVQNNIRVVNAFDTSVIGDYIGSAEGEKVIMNVVRKNPTMLRQLVRS